MGENVDTNQIQDAWLTCFENNAKLCGGASCPKLSNIIDKYILDDSSVSYGIDAYKKLLESVFASVLFASCFNQSTVQLNQLEIKRPKIVIVCERSKFSPLKSKFETFTKNNSLVNFIAVEKNIGTQAIPVGNVRILFCPYYLSDCDIGKVNSAIVSNQYANLFGKYLGNNFYAEHVPGGIHSYKYDYALKMNSPNAGIAISIVLMYSSSNNIDISDNDKLNLFFDSFSLFYENNLKDLVTAPSLGKLNDICIAGINSGMPPTSNTESIDLNTADGIEKICEELTKQQDLKDMGMITQEVFNVDYDESTMFFVWPRLPAWRKAVYSDTDDEEKYYRPFFGYTPKSKLKPASLKVFQLNDYKYTEIIKGIPEVAQVPPSIYDAFYQMDASDKGVPKKHSWYTDFIINEIQQSRSDNMQVFPTFQNIHLFFSRSQMVTINVGGFVMNTEDFPWKEEMLKNYENIRGSKLAENGMVCVLTYDRFAYVGYITSLNMSESSTNSDEMAMFNFSYVVLDTIYEEDEIHYKYRDFVEIYEALKLELVAAKKVSENNGEITTLLEDPNISSKEKEFLIYYKKVYDKNKFDVLHLELKNIITDLESQVEELSKAQDQESIAQQLIPLYDGGPYGAYGFFTNNPEYKKPIGDIVDAVLNKIIPGLNVRTIRKIGGTIEDLRTEGLKGAFFQGQSWEREFKLSKDMDMFGYDIKKPGA